MRTSFSIAFEFGLTMRVGFIVAVECVARQPTKMPSFKRMIKLGSQRVRPSNGSQPSGPLVPGSVEAGATGP